MFSTFNRSTNINNESQVLKNATYYCAATNKSYYYNAQQELEMKF